MVSPPDTAIDPADPRLPDGLTTAEARRRLEDIGVNAMPDARVAAWRRAAGKFWAPVPWMLEAAILLQLSLGEYAEAAVIAVLLVFNAALGFFQEGRAQATLEALQVAPRAERLGPPRRRVEDGAGGRAGAGRHREAVAGRRRRRRCAADRAARCCSTSRC